MVTAANLAGALRQAQRSAAGAADKVTSQCQTASEASSALKSARSRVSRNRSCQRKHAAEIDVVRDMFELQHLPAHYSLPAQLCRKPQVGGKHWLRCRVARPDDACRRSTAFGVSAAGHKPRRKSALHRAPDTTHGTTMRAASSTSLSNARYSSLTSLRPHPCYVRLCDLGLGICQLRWVDVNRIPRAASEACLRARAPLQVCRRRLSECFGLHCPRVTARLQISRHLHEASLRASNDSSAAAAGKLAPPCLRGRSQRQQGMQHTCRSHKQVNTTCSLLGACSPFFPQEASGWSACTIMRAVLHGHRCQVPQMSCLEVLRHCNKAVEPLCAWCRSIYSSSKQPARAGIQLPARNPACPAMRH